MLLQRIMGRRCAIGLLRTFEYKLDLTRPYEITETRIKGITELSNILTGWEYSF